jgi:hypothetical protein
MTKSPETFERPVIRSSVTPSLKYSWVGSWLMFVKGSTATDGLSGKAGPENAGPLSHRQPAHPTAPRSTRMATIPAIVDTRRRAVRRFGREGAGWAPGSRRSRYTRTGRAMFLTVCSPRKS